MHKHNKYPWDNVKPKRIGIAIEVPKLRCYSSYTEEEIAASDRAWKWMWIRHYAALFAIPFVAYAIFCLIS